MATLALILFFGLSATQEEGAKSNLKDNLRASVVSVISYDIEGRILVRGSGFFASERGDVLTRKSLIPAEAARTEVVTSDNKVYEVTRILVTDDKLDLIRVLLNETPLGVKPLPGATFSPQFGDRVFVVSRGTLIDGIVTEPLDPINGKTFGITVFAEAPANGSPVFNLKGEVTGVVLATKDTRSSFTAHLLHTDSALYPRGAAFQPIGDIKEESAPALIRRGEHLFQGSAISRTAPAYPIIAKQERVDGTIVVQLVVSETGDVLSAEVIKTQLRHHGGKVDEIPTAAEEALKQAAVQAVRQWKFTPTMLEGKLIKVLGTVTLNFHL